MADEPKCPKCGDSGWKPHRDANGDRVWLPFMNDALPCECGALARKYAAEKAASGVTRLDGETPSQNHQGVDASGFGEGVGR